MHTRTATTDATLEALIGRELRVLTPAETREAKARGIDARTAYRTGLGLFPVAGAEGDDDGGTGDDDGKGGKDDGDDDGDDDKSKAGKSGDDDTDGDDDDDGKGTELERAQRAAAKANSELRKLRREREDEETAAKKEAGKYKELYEEEKAKREELEGKVAEGAKRTLIEAAAKKANARNPATVFKLLKADGKLADVEDDVDARRAVRDLLKEDPDLKAEGRRQTRSKDDDDERDDDRDEKDDKTKTKKPVSRLARGLAASG